MGYDGVSRAALLVVRLLGLAVVLGFVLEIVVVREGIATYASLFCKWPATISCPTRVFPTSGPCCSSL